MSYRPLNPPPKAHGWYWEPCAMSVRLNRLLKHPGNHIGVSALMKILDLSEKRARIEIFSAGHAGKGYITKREVAERFFPEARSRFPTVPLQTKEVLAAPHTTLAKLEVVPSETIADYWANHNIAHHVGGHKGANIISKARAREA